MKLSFTFYLAVIYVSMSLPLRTFLYRFCSPSFRLERLLPTFRSMTNWSRLTTGYSHKGETSSHVYNLNCRYVIRSFQHIGCKGTAFF